MCFKFAITTARIELATFGIKSFMNSPKKMPNPQDVNCDSFEFRFLKLEK